MNPGGVRDANSPPCTAARPMLAQVHERSLQSDFLLIILKEVLRRRPALRIILMSATINARLFADYFGTVPAVVDASGALTGGAPLTPAPTLHIPGFTHPASGARGRTSSRAADV